MGGLLVALGFLMLSVYLSRLSVRMWRAQRRVRHPAAGRFCHICGADSFRNEPCDGGLHS